MYNELMMMMMMMTMIIVFRGLITVTVKISSFLLVRMGDNAAAQYDARQQTSSYLLFGHLSISMQLITRRSAVMI